MSLYILKELSNKMGLPSPVNAGTAAQFSDVSHRPLLDDCIFDDDCIIYD